MRIGVRRDGVRSFQSAEFVAQFIDPKHLGTHLGKLRTPNPPL